MSAGLYIHVPFCESKCYYCDFYSVAPASRRERSDYLKALTVELAELPPEFEPDTVYIGGGTPTVLDEDMLTVLLGSVSRAVDLDKVDEYTVEANPGTLTDEKLAVLSAAGVGRISLGAQSFDDRTLDFLGRGHSAAEIYRSVDAVRAAGIDNLSLDLIFGVPGTDLNSTETDLDRLLPLEADHVSSYALIIAPGTRLQFLREQGDIRELDEDLIAAQFQLVRDTLTRAGWEHYEISNYARTGRRCMHNMLYWSGGDYIGCGPAAHSHWQGVRYSNISNLWEYTQSLSAGRSPRSESEQLPPEAKARETLVMWLRRLDGVDVEEFRQATGYNPFDLCQEEIEHLREDGLLKVSDGTIALSEEAIFISDTVFRELV